MTTFAEINALHDVANSWQGERILIEHPELEALSVLIGKFRGALGESADDAYWEPVVRMLVRARWDAATTPLPLSSPGAGLAEARRSAVARLRQCPRVAPELAAAAADLADRLADLGASADDPLGDAVRDVLSHWAGELDASMARRGIAEDSQLTLDGAGGLGAPLTDTGWPGVGRRVAVLLRNGRYSEDVKAAVARFGRPIAVLTPPALIASRPLDLVIAVGPSAWFPPSVTRTGRARRLVFAYPAWLRDSEPQEALLAGSGQRATRSRIAPAPARTSLPFDAGLPLAPADEWVPQADWRGISAAGHQPRGNEASSEPIDAWLFALASGEGVYLEAAEGSRAYIAEIDEDVSVRQELTARIQEGDFLVLRTEGDGDYIRVMADSILGRDAPRLRALQAEWKSKLADAMAELGSRGLRAELQQEGAIRASDQNVRQWIRPDSIRTRDPADFAAIVSVIGERARFRELWNAMGTIDSAHRRAGFQVRALLLAELRGGDRSVLTARGWADFDVAEIEGEGALRVARVEGRAPDKQPVTPSRTRHQFEIGRDLWLG